MKHTGKQPDYLGEASLPAAVKLGPLEAALLAPVNLAGTARLDTTASTLIEILQAGNILLSLHVKCCNWHDRQNNCHVLQLTSSADQLSHMSMAAGADQLSCLLLCAQKETFPTLEKGVDARDSFEHGSTSMGKQPSNSIQMH